VIATWIVIDKLFDLPHKPLKVRGTRTFCTTGNVHGTPSSVQYTPAPKPTFPENEHFANSTGNCSNPASGGNNSSVANNETPSSSGGHITRSNVEVSGAILGKDAERRERRADDHFYKCDSIFDFRFQQEIKSMFEGDPIGADGGGGYPRALSGRWIEVYPAKCWVSKPIPMDSVPLGCLQPCAQHKDGCVMGTVILDLFVEGRTLAGGIHEI
jgi:hypothetical protein